MIRQTSSGHWIIDGDMWISAWVEEKGALQHDYQTLPLILEYIKPGDVVVDAGANIGDTTGPFLDRVGPTGKVLAFEPHHEAFECLRQNCPRAITYHLALGAKLGKTDVRASEECPNNIGACYLDKGKSVMVQTLDFLALKRCDFIKIDVEGFELAVLEGAQDTITKFRPKLAIEINEKALRRQEATTIKVLQWLDWLRYQCWPLNSPNREEPLPQYDIIALPE